MMRQNIIKKKKKEYKGQKREKPKARPKKE